MDDDLYEASLAEARASIRSVPDQFERTVEMLKIDTAYRMYCFIPDAAAIERLAETELNVQEYAQWGYTSAVKLMAEGPLDDECQPVAETIDDSDAAMAHCTMTLQLRTSTTYYTRVDYILDGDRFIALTFMGVDEELLELYGKIAETVTFIE
ncbi:MAG: hypothetical protein A2Z14_12725 [Chloroflexi bacterium RBG_16_48_8]|nr:MAG: hypothetical protein A2Z14_12725 [Chloroflexi bacterium RBG_16_48_8]